MGCDFVFDVIGEAIDLQEGVDCKIGIINDIRDWITDVEKDLLKG